MSQRVVLAGHCGPDSSYLRLTVSAALPGAKVGTVEDAAELEQAIRDGVHLVLVNRLLDYGFEQTEGVALIEDLRTRHPDVKTMLVSNYPEAQQAAIAAGAVGAFGKRELRSPRVAELLREAIKAPDASASPE